MADKIEDFGEKIGGAKKDLAAARKNGGLDITSISEWTDVERDKHVKKDNVFPKPDYQKLMEDGLPREVVYFIKTVRDSLPAKPKWENSVNVSEYNKIQREQNSLYLESRRMERHLKNLEAGTTPEDSGLGTTEETKQRLLEIKERTESLETQKTALMTEALRKAQEDYIATIGTIRDRVLSLTTEEACRNFAFQIYSEVKKGQFPHDVDLNKFYRNTDLRNTYDYARFLTDMKMKQFLYTEEEKALSGYQIFQYNGSNIVTGDKNRPDCILVKYGSSTRYTYRNSEELQNQENWQVGTYFAVSEINNIIVGNNFVTEEAAREFVLQLEQERSAASQGKKDTDKAQKKTKFIPTTLAHVVRVGEDYLEGREVTEQALLDALHIRAGEYGNWVNQAERAKHNEQLLLSAADMCKAISVPLSDFSLGENLAIAFGARGNSGAAAHFEPDRNVINLTRMNGAGSLAHEYGHALDYFIARTTGLADMFATESRNSLVAGIVETMKYKTVDGKRVETDFLKNAKALDKLHSKQDKGYWRSDVEMFARAFACYIMDKLQPGRNDYLCGHAENASFDFVNQRAVPHYPEGDERKAINEQFDRLFEVLKERGILHHQDYDMEARKPLIETSIATGAIVERHDEDKQKKAKAKTKPEAEHDEGEQLAFTFEEETPASKPQQPKAASKAEPVTTPTVPSPESIAETFKAVFERMQEQIAIAEKLQVGDVIVIEPTYMTDSKTFRREKVGGGYSVVSSVNEDEITFRDYRDAELKEFYAIGGYRSTPNEHWTTKLASAGFAAVSVKALEGKSETKPQQTNEAEQNEIQTANDSPTRRLPDTPVFKKEKGKMAVVCKGIVYGFSEHPDYPQVRQIAEETIRSTYGEPSDPAEFRAEVRALTAQYMMNLTDVPANAVVTVEAETIRDVDKNQLRKQLSERYGVTAADFTFAEAAADYDIMSQSVYDGIERVLQSSDYARLMDMTESIGNYTFKNIAMLYGQMPEATEVKSFNVWKHDSDRVVSKGEKALNIWCPVTKVLKSEEDVDKHLNGYRFRSTPPELLAAKKEQLMQTIADKGSVTELIGYRLGAVFDISQTTSRNTDREQPKTKPFEASEKHAESAALQVLQDYGAEPPKGALFDEIAWLTETVLRERPETVHGIRNDTPVSDKVHQLEAAIASGLIARHLGLDDSGYAEAAIETAMNPPVITSLAQSPHEELQQAYERGMAFAKQFNKEFDKVYEGLTLEADRTIEATDSDLPSLEEIIRKTSIVRSQKREATIAMTVSGANVQAALQRVPEEERADIDASKPVRMIMGIRNGEIRAKFGGKYIELTEKEAEIASKRITGKAREHTER